MRVEGKRYRFVSLGAAQSDAAYRTPDTYFTKYGPMWDYRCARERDVKVGGAGYAKVDSGVRPTEWAAGRFTIERVCHLSKP
jgi:hypothetical protein